MASRTPLFERHRAAGARFIEFGGWEMPLQYSGIVDEHLTVRQAVGLFDVSHMGKIFVEGSTAHAFLDRFSANDVPTSSGKARYTDRLRASRAVGRPPARGSTGNRGVGEVEFTRRRHPARTGPLRCQWTGLVSRHTNGVHRRGGIRALSDTG